MRYLAALGVSARDEFGIGTFRIGLLDQACPIDIEDGKKEKEKSVISKPFSYNVLVGGLDFFGFVIH